MYDREFCFISPENAPPNELTQAAATIDMPWRCLSFADAEREDWATNWNRVVVLDAREDRRTAFDRLIQLKSDNAGLPVIVIARADERPMGQVAVARYDGAEAILFWPLAPPSLAANVLSDAVAKLNRWWQTLEATSRASAPIAMV